MFGTNETLALLVETPLTDAPLVQHEPNMIRLVLRAYTLTVL
jgi:hypothetical protein